MSFQLIYTSAERGLKSGSRGFTTVAMTEGMPAHCLQLCESMSGYVHVFELNSGNYERNPVGWSHYRIKSGPNVYSVVSRVSAHPRDYTGRTNKIAHHLMLEHPRELQSYANGPGDLLGSPFFCEEWTGAPRFLPEGQQPPPTQARLDSQAGHWQAAGLPPSAVARIALALEQGGDSPIVLLFEAGANDDRVGLIQDILDLLPAAKRWEIGFSTYYSMHPTGADIHIRACAKGTDAARRAARHPRAVVVDLTNGSIEGLQHLPEADASLLSAATNGTMPDWAQEPDPPAPQRQPEATEESEKSPQFKPLPPPRPDRPGAVRKRKPPPPPGKARLRNGAHSSKTPKKLIGALLGLLLLLGAGGLVLLSRNAGEMPVQDGTTILADTAETATPEPEKNRDHSPEDTKGDGNDPVPAPDSEVEDYPEVVQEDGDDQGTEDPPEDGGDDGAGEVDNETGSGGTSQQPEQEIAEPVVTFKQLDFPVEIPENGEDYYFFTHEGKKVPLKISFGMGRKPFLVTDDNNSEEIKNNELTEAHIAKAAILLFKTKEESHLVYYRSEPVNVSSSYKDGSIVIEVDSENNLHSFMQAFHEKLTYAIEGRQAEVNFSDGDIRLDDAGVESVQSIQALVKEQREKERKDLIKDITSLKGKLKSISSLERRKDEKEKNYIETEEEFIKRKMEVLQKFIISAFKAEGGLADDENLSRYFSSYGLDKNKKDPRYKLYEELDRKKASDYASEIKREKYEKEMAVLLKETYTDVGLDKWIAACSAALEAATEDRLKNHDPAPSDPPSFNFDVKVNTDVLIRINVSIE